MNSPQTQVGPPQRLNSLLVWRDYTAKEQSSTYGYITRMLYFGCHMKRLLRPSTILIVSLLLILISTAFSQSISEQSFKLANTTGTVLFFQTTNTPPPKQDKSEIGSTDGITILSFVIVTIIVLPIVIKRKDWTQT